jgi:hypothetical protein
MNPKRMREQATHSLSEKQRFADAICLRRLSIG